MKTIDISSRLETLTHYVSPYKYVIDVGTDHCFVPIFLKQKGIIDGAIASDINEGPINEARKNIAKYGFSDTIEARCGNGLETITQADQTDVIIVAGMGGKLITDILSSNSDAINRNKRLILQANVASDVIREWLGAHGYQIVHEEMIIDNEIAYEIIVADKTDQPVTYSPEEIMFGPILLHERSETFLKKWFEVLAFKRDILTRIPEGHANRPIISEEIKLLERALDQK